MAGCQARHLKCGMEVLDLNASRFPPRAVLPSEHGWKVPRTRLALYKNPSDQKLDV